MVVRSQTHVPGGSSMNLLLCLHNRALFAKLVLGLGLMGLYIAVPICHEIESNTAVWIARKL